MKWVISVLIAVSLMVGGIFATPPVVSFIQCGGPPSCLSCYSNCATARCYSFSQPLCYNQDVTERAEDAALLSINNSCIITGGSPSGIIQFYNYSYDNHSTYQDATVCAKRTCDKCTVAGDPCAGVNCGDFIIGGDPNQPPNPCCPSPIIIDVNGDGFQLTSAFNGVFFDLNADYKSEHLSWTAQGSDDAFLALDRNHNGIIDDGSELFGNFTQQLESGHRNGFAALAMFDSNDDGGIDQQDPIFQSLLLWRDIDHCGRSESQELTTLALAGITSIRLDYKWSARRDQYGNTFRYRTRVNGTQGQSFAYDVFFVKGS